MGLISSGPGRGTSDLTDPGISMSFHFVEEAEVQIGDGLGGRCLPVGVTIGVRWSGNLGGGFWLYGVWAGVG